MSDQELKKAEDLLKEVKGLVSKQVEEVKKSPIKTAIRGIIFIWALKAAWKWIIKK